MIKVGINGFGRIGRNIAKVITNDPRVKISHINDIVPSLQNLAYLYNFDSVYGKPTRKARVLSESTLEIGEDVINFTSHENLDEVPWDTHYIIDATGVKANLLIAKSMVSDGVIKKYIATNSPVEGADKVIIMGVNDTEYDPSSQHVLGSSICDANAIAHFIKWAGENFGLEGAYITTLHPWLSYQNLVDAPVHSISSPTHYWNDYSLGRSSVGSLIPKSTTAAQAVLQALPQYKGRIDAVSYRTPTAIVSSADITICLENNIQEKDLFQSLEAFVNNSPYLRLNQESLISIDYLKESSSGVLDHQWTKLMNGRLLKLIVWYDNEWGYSCRAVDLLKHVAEQSQ